MKNKLFLLLPIIFLTVLWSANTYAAKSNEDLAKQTQSPVADLISVPFQNNTNFGLGPHNRTQNILNIQPVVPFNLTDSINLITRTILPIIRQPDLARTSGDTNGLGDINLSLFFFSCRFGPSDLGDGTHPPISDRHR